MANTEKIWIILCISFCKYIDWSGRSNQAGIYTVWDDGVTRGRCDNIRDGCAESCDVRSDWALSLFFCLVFWVKCFSSTTMTGITEWGHVIYTSIISHTWATVVKFKGIWSAYILWDQLNTIHPFLSPQRTHIKPFSWSVAPNFFYKAPPSQLPNTHTAFQQSSGGGTTHILPTFPLLGRVMICKENH